MEAGIPPYFEWIKNNIPKGTTIGVDSSQIPASAFLTRQKYFQEGGIELIPTPTNFVDDIWQEDEKEPKPNMPKEKVWVLDDKFTGQSV